MTVIVALTYVSLGLTVLLMAWTLSKGRRKTRLRPVFDVARTLVQIAVAVAIPLITGVTTAVPLIVGAAILGVGLGVLQGQNVLVELEERGIYVTRGVLAFAIWGGGLLVMQAAGLANRTGYLQLGQGVAWFSVGVSVGLVVGRQGKVDALARAAVATVSGVCLVALVVSMPNISTATAQNGGQWVRGPGRVVSGAPAFDSTGSFGLTGGTLVDVVLTSGGDDPGQATTSVSWEEPPPFLGGGESKALRGSIDSVSISYVGSGTFQKTMFLEVRNNRVTWQSFPTVMYWCTGEFECFVDPPSASGTVVLSLGAGSEGDQAIVRWGVHNCGALCDVEWTYTWQATGAGPGPVDPGPAAPPPPEPVIVTENIDPNAIPETAVIEDSGGDLFPSDDTATESEAEVAPQPEPNESAAARPLSDSEVQPDTDPGSFAAPEQTPAQDDGQGASERPDDEDVSEQEALASAIAILIALLASGVISNSELFEAAMAGDTMSLLDETPKPGFDDDAMDLVGNAPIGRGRWSRNIGDSLRATDLDNDGDVDLVEADRDGDGTFESRLRREGTHEDGTARFVDDATTPDPHADDAAVSESASNASDEAAGSPPRDDLGGDVQQIPVSPTNLGNEVDVILTGDAAERVRELWQQNLQASWDDTLTNQPIDIAIPFDQQAMVTFGDPPQQLGHLGNRGIVQGIDVVGIDENGEPIISIRVAPYGPDAPGPGPQADAPEFSEDDFPDADFGEVSVAPQADAPEFSEDDFPDADFKDVPASPSAPAQPTGQGAGGDLPDDPMEQLTAAAEALADSDAAGELISRQELGRIADFLVDPDARSVSVSLADGIPVEIGGRTIMFDTAIPRAGGGASIPMMGDTGGVALQIDLTVENGRLVPKLTTAPGTNVAIATTAELLIDKLAPGSFTERIAGLNDAFADTGRTITAVSVVDGELVIEAAPSGD